MSIEKFGGDFEAAILACPFLSNLGEAALEAMRLEMEVIQAEQVAEEAPAERRQAVAHANAIESRPKKTKKTETLSHGVINSELEPVQAVEQIEFVGMQATKPKTQLDVGPGVAEQIYAQMVQPLERHDSHVWFDAAIGTSEQVLVSIDVDTTAAQLELTPEAANASVAATSGYGTLEREPVAEVAPGPVVDVHEDIVESAAVVNTQPATELVTNVSIAAESFVEFAAGEHAQDFADEHLIAESLPTVGVSGFEQVEAPVDARFYEQLEATIVEELEKPEVQAVVREMIAEVFALVAEQLTGDIGSEIEPAGFAADAIETMEVASSANETNESEIAAVPLEIMPKPDELIRLVTGVLQRLGTPEPSPEEVQAFIARVRFEVNVQQLERAFEQPAFDGGMHEYVSKFTVAGHMHLPSVLRKIGHIRMLGLAALLQPSGLQLLAV